MPDKSIMSWTVNKKLDNAIQWMIIPTDDLCNGKRMVRELCLCNDLSFYFLVMGKKVFKWNINEQELTKEFLDNVFEFCAMVPLCKGFEVEIEALAKDKQGGVTELPTPRLLKSGDSWADRKNCSVCPLGSLWWSVLTRDHNTKRAKLGIDVCAMFTATKAIFSNFAIACARAQTIFDATVCSLSISRREHPTNINNEICSLNIMVCCH